MVLQGDRHPQPPCTYAGMPSTQRCDHQTHSSKYSWGRREEGRRDHLWVTQLLPASRQVTDFSDVGFTLKNLRQNLRRPLKPSDFNLVRAGPSPVVVFQGKAICMGQEESMLLTLSPTNIYVQTDMVRNLKAHRVTFSISSPQGEPEEYDSLALRRSEGCSQTKSHSAFPIALTCLHPTPGKEKKNTDHLLSARIQNITE